MSNSVAELLIFWRRNHSLLVRFRTNSQTGEEEFMMVSKGAANCATVGRSSMWFAAAALCIAALGLAGCKRGETAASGAAGANAPASADDAKRADVLNDMANQIKEKIALISAGKIDGPTGPVYYFPTDDPLKGHIEAIIVASTEHNLGLHITCAQGETIVSLVADHELTTNDTVPADERVGDGPVTHGAWLITSRRTGVIYSGQYHDETPPSEFVEALLHSRSYTVELAPAGSDPITAQFDLTHLGPAFRAHGQGCGWANWT